MSENAPRRCEAATWLPYAHGGPVAQGRIKDEPEDFVVDELLGFQPCGDGEHVFLRIEKRGENTEYVASQLARFANVSRRAIGYAGLKDRHGVTTQWFSVHRPGTSEPNWHGLTTSTIIVRECVRHHRKLKKGALRGNRFEITVRELDATPDRLTEHLRQIARLGVPNYFGPQRFGRDGQNLIQAESLFRGERKTNDRHLDGIYLSAARSHIFNQILAYRVDHHSWNRAIPGDVFMFTGSQSIFKDLLTPEIRCRIEKLEIHPSGPLWGKGISAATEEALAIETSVAGNHPLLCDGLAARGMDMARRSLRLSVSSLQWDFLEAGVLRLSFVLPAGAYATAVLREVVESDHPLH